jgi:hypothetical protein
MKTHVLQFSGWLFILLLFHVSMVSGQVMYQYPLSSDFKGQPAGAPDLIQIPNNSSQTGHFTDRAIPASTCGTAGTAHGYFFEDDAGLQFNNPSGFINQSYSIAFNFQVDEFTAPPDWVRIMSFTHTDDVGIYIELTDPPYHGTLEFWPNGTVGTYNFFTTTDFYQLILVRDDAGLIKIYVNGETFADYDDSQTQSYVPQPPNNYIIWFRDDPSVLAGEASPGFVSDIRIANYAWTTQKVQQVWAQFCSSLMNIQEYPGNDFRIHPNPVADKLAVEIPGDMEPCSVSICNMTGQMILTREDCKNETTLDVRHLDPGIYILQVKNSNYIRKFRLIKQ